MQTSSDWFWRADPVSGRTAGHTIRVFNGSLSAKLSGNINGSEVLAIECELEVLASANGGASYAIYPPEVTPA